MVHLLQQGEWVLFAVIIAALVISLSFHEFGHAWVAKQFGDDTAERAGRLTINPRAHIDPMGLLMVVMIGFGYAKQVPRIQGDSLLVMQTSWWQPQGRG